MRIAVLGATGVLGRHVVPRLIERGHAVRAAYRRDEAAPALRRAGAEPVAADLVDPASLAPLLRGCDAALHLATAIPKPGPAMDWSANDRIRREGTRHLLAACAAAAVPRAVIQSVAMLHADPAGGWADEDSPLKPSPVLASAADMEALARAGALDARLVRGGAFYGPGTGREAGWRAAARAGTLKVPGDGGAYISLIHVADMAAAIVAALETDRARGTWIAADDAPVTYGELLDHIAAEAGAPKPPRGGPMGLASFRVRNDRIKRELGWRPAYASYRSGLAE